MKNQKSLMQWYCLQGWCSNTCEQFSESVLKTVLVCWLASETNYSVFMVMVKNAKQPRLGDGALVFLQTFAETQKGKQCNSFLSSYSNKHELIRLFFIKWKAKATQRIDNKVFNIAAGVFLRFSAYKFNEEHILLSNQERLDTRMLPHLKHIIALILACYYFV